jgi:hypothetical protein
MLRSMTQSVMRNDDDDNNDDDDCGDGDDDDNDDDDNDDDDNDDDDDADDADDDDDDDNDDNDDDDDDADVLTLFARAAQDIIIMAKCPSARPPGWRSRRRVQPSRHPQADSRGGRAAGALRRPRLSS